MSVTVPAKPGVPTAPHRQTPGVTVVGWLLVCFGSLPVLVGIHDASRTALAIGGVAMAAGAVAVLVGRLLSTRGREK